MQSYFRLPDRASSCRVRNVSAIQKTSVFIPTLSNFLIWINFFHFNDNIWILGTKSMWDQYSIKYLNQWPDPPFCYFARYHSILNSEVGDTFEFSFISRDIFISLPWYQNDRWWNPNGLDLSLSDLKKAIYRPPSWISLSSPLLCF